jgi:hypothetical protein
MRRAPRVTAPSANFQWQTADSRGSLAPRASLHIFLSFFPLFLVLQAISVMIVILFIS